MAATKRTKTEREEALARVAELDRWGLSTTQIARDMGVSQSQVVYDLKIIRKRYANAQLESRQALINRKVAEYRQLRAECWMAYLRSCQDAVETRTVKERPQTPPPNGNGKHVEVEVPGELEVVGLIETRKGQSGNPAYLDIIRKTWQDERELLGLDAPKHVEGSLNIVSWQILLSQVPDKTPDTIEAEIEAARAGQPVETPSDPQRPQIGLKELPNKVNPQTGFGAWMAGDNPAPPTPTAAEQAAEDAREEEGEWEDAE